VSSIQLHVIPRAGIPLHFVCARQKSRRVCASRRYRVSSEIAVDPRPGPIDKVGQTSQDANQASWMRAETMWEKISSAAYRLCRLNIKRRLIHLIDIANGRASISTGS
jgi:hypothetical protein